MAAIPVSKVERSQIAGLAIGDSMNSSLGSNAVAMRIAPMASPGMPTTLRADRLDREAGLFLRFVSPLVGQPNFAVPGVCWRRPTGVVSQSLPLSSAESTDPAARSLCASTRRKGRRGSSPLFSGATAADSWSAISIRTTPFVAAWRAGREDFLAALSWIAENGASIGIETTRLAIGGDSAGGNISAAVAQENLRRGGPKLQLQVLVYPATNLLAEFPSKIENGQGHFMTADFMDSLRPLIEQGKDLMDPWLSPALNPDLRVLPPGRDHYRRFRSDPRRWTLLCRAIARRRSSGGAAALSRSVSRLPEF